MSKLDDFLGLSDVSEIRETIKVKIGDKDFELVVKPISQEEHSEFQKRATTISKNKSTIDINKYNNLLLETCIVEPNFRDAEFLKKAKCLSAIEFLNKKFPAGTLMDISSKIQEISGFDTFDMEIEEAKN